MDRYDGRCIGGPYADRDLVAANKFIPIERLVGPINLTGSNQHEINCLTHYGVYLFKDVSGTGTDGLWLWRAEK